MRTYTFLCEKRCALRGKQIQQQRQGMASYHCQAKIGGKGSGGSHAEYIAREGKYQGFDRYEDLAAKGSGNMPAWASTNPVDFWKAADEYERKNGSTYREIEVALPRELSLEQNQALLEDFIRREIGEKRAYQWAMHDKKAALEKGDQMHAHIMHGLREVDGIERDPEQYFKRYNAKNPEKGGARKDSGKHPAELAKELRDTRKLWADVQNEHLAKHGHSVRVDHRSLREQGIDRQPEPHFGPDRAAKMTQAEVAQLLEQRQIEGQRQRADAELKASIIDVSGDLKAAQQALIDQKAAAFAAKAEQRMQEKAEAARTQQREQAAAEQAQQQREAQAMAEKRQAWLKEQAAKLAQVEKHQVKQRTPAPTKGKGYDGPGLG